MAAVSIAEDRSLRVPPGFIVRTAYVEIHRIRHGCRDRMDAAAVERASNRFTQLGGSQAWPPPTGEWSTTEPGVFVLHDGRHAHLGAWIAGYSHLLVCWTAPVDDS